MEPGERQMCWLALAHPAAVCLPCLSWLKPATTAGTSAGLQMRHVFVAGVEGSVLLYTFVAATHLVQQSLLRGSIAGSSLWDVRQQGL
jgi:hypothetical protein